MIGPKLKALIKTDAKKHAGGLGAVIDDIMATGQERSRFEKSEVFKHANARWVFSDNADPQQPVELFETLLAALPSNRADDLCRLFLYGVFYGISGPGERSAEVFSKSEQKYSGSEGGRKTAKKNAAAADEKWRNVALTHAQNFQREEPDAGQDAIAHMLARKMGDAVPGHTRLKQIIGRWQKDGLLHYVRKGRAGPALS